MSCPPLQNWIATCSISLIAVVFQQWMYGIWNIIFHVISIRLLSTTFLGGDKSHSYTEAWSHSYETLCDHLCMLSSLNILSIVMTQITAIWSIHYFSLLCCSPQDKIRNELYFVSMTEIFLLFLLVWAFGSYQQNTQGEHTGKVW